MVKLLYIFSIFFVISGILTALIILLHIYPRHKQPMKIMEAVWPLTGLWASWAGLWAYFRIGQPKEGMMMHHAMSPTLSWHSITLSTLHCGAGCTLADLLGETFTTFVPITIGSSMLAGQWVLDYILALLFGIYFQYSAIRPMEQLPRLEVVKKAFKIDFFSLTAWQIGMYGWMALVIFVFREGIPLSHTSWEFWFMMQIAMCFGFMFSYPANWLLMKMGVKKGM